jgi:hypothetical protein
MERSHLFLFKYRASPLRHIRFIYGRLQPRLQEDRQRPAPSRKSKGGRLGPSANNWKFRGHKADTQVEKRYLARATRIMCNQTVGVSYSQHESFPSMVVPLSFCDVSGGQH